ncbi:polysaccharide deacetylase [Soehngenia saccharolytica]|nr:polysaccharide deacetylase [Soehngenia saccharolytica]
MKRIFRLIFIILIILLIILFSGKIKDNESKALAQSIDVYSLLSNYYYDNFIEEEIKNEKHIKEYNIAENKQEIIIRDYYLKIEEENKKLKAKNIKSTKNAYLTFDDGPSDKSTKEILEILDKYNVKATFFVLGSMAEKNPETLKFIHESGHSIGNHGYSHNYKYIYSGTEKFFSDIEKCESVLKSILGDDFYTKLLRFPGGSSGNRKLEIKNEALSRGYDVVDWNALNGDAEKSNPSREYLIKRFKETHKNKKNIIILMHDTNAKETTVEVLPYIIETLINEGYTLKALDEK